MLCREIIAVCSDIHTKHINARCGHNIAFLVLSLVERVFNYRVVEQTAVWATETIE